MKKHLAEHILFGISLLAAFLMSSPALYGACGPGAHFLDNCAPGVDQMNSTGKFTIELTNVGTFAVDLDGPVQVYHGAPIKGSSPHRIPSEIVDLKLQGNANNMPLTLVAGDSLGNLIKDGPLYSPGQITEKADPAKADSFFDVFFEIKGLPIGTLHNKVAIRLNCSDITELPPISCNYVHDFTTGRLELYDANDQLRGFLTDAVHTPTSVGPGMCGPGPHFLDRCPPGTDRMNSKGKFTIYLKDGITSCAEALTAPPCTADLTGPVDVYHGTPILTPEPHHLPSEIVDMKLEGKACNLFDVTLVAGDGVGNVKSDGPLYSPGQIVEKADPSKADSFFDVFFEIQLPRGSLRNKRPVRLNCNDITKLPPLECNYVHDFSAGAVELYDANDEVRGCLTDAVHIPTAIKGVSFRAVEQASGEVLLQWETANERQTVAFRILRSASVAGPFIPIMDGWMKAAGRAAEYRFTDSSPGSGPVYYQVEELTYSGRSEAHGPFRLERRAPDAGESR